MRLSKVWESPAERATPAHLSRLLHRPCETLLHVERSRSQGDDFVLVTRQCRRHCVGVRETTVTIESAAELPVKLAGVRAAIYWDRRWQRARSGRPGDSAIY